MGKFSVYYMKNSEQSGKTFKNNKRVCPSMYKAAREKFIVSALLNAKWPLFRSFLNIVRIPNICFVSVKGQ